MSWTEFGNVCEPPGKTYGNTIFGAGAVTMVEGSPAIVVLCCKCAGFAILRVLDGTG